VQLAVSVLLHAEPRRECQCTPALLLLLLLLTARDHLQLVKGVAAHQLRYQHLLLLLLLLLQVLHQ
jgi:hypothetical protein